LEACAGTVIQHRDRGALQRRVYKEQSPEGDAHGDTGT